MQALGRGNPLHRTKPAKYARAGSRRYRQPHCLSAADLSVAIQSVRVTLPLTETQTDLMPTTPSTAALASPPCWTGQTSDVSSCKVLLYNWLQGVL